MAKKLPIKKTETPMAIVRGAYKLELAPEATEKLQDIKEYGGYVVLTFNVGFCRKVQIAAVGLGFACKGVLQIL